jgi:hypothetical protein
LYVFYCCQTKRRTEAAQPLTKEFVAEKKAGFPTLRLFQWQNETANLQNLRGENTTETSTT